MPKPKQAATQRRDGDGAACPEGKMANPIRDIHKYAFIENLLNPDPVIHQYAFIENLLNPDPVIHQYAFIELRFNYIFNYITRMQDYGA